MPPTSTSLTLLNVQAVNPTLFLNALRPENGHFSRISSPQSAGSESLVFVSDAKDYTKAFSQGARHFVLSAKLQNLKFTDDTSILFTRNVTLALTQVSNRLFPDRENAYLENGIHPKANIDSSAEIASGVRVAPGVYVGPRCKIGPNVSIGPNSVIEGDVTIDADTAIEALVFIGRRTQIGRNCVIKSNTTIGSAGFGFSHDEKGHHFRIPQTGRVVLEDRVEIGAGCTIDRATFDETRIKEGTKFDNMIHIAHNTIIGRNGLLAGKFATAGSVTIGDHFMCGGRVSVTDHVTITDQVQIGGLSGVSNDITKPGAYAGYPLLPLREHLRAVGSISELPNIRRKLTKILTHLGLKEDGEKS